MEKFRRLEREGHNFQVERASSIFELLYFNPDFDGKLPWCPDLDGVIAEYVLEDSDDEDDDNSENQRERANAQTETDAEVAFQVGKRLKEMLIEVESLDY